MSERDTLFQERLPYEYTTRGLLESATECSWWNASERKALQEYKKILNLLQNEESRLFEIQNKLFHLKANAFNFLRRKRLEKQAAPCIKFIDLYSHKLLEMEHTKPILDILMRERQLKESIK